MIGQWTRTMWTPFCEPYGIEGNWSQISICLSRPILWKGLFNYPSLTDFPSLVLMVRATQSHIMVTVYWIMMMCLPLLALLPSSSQGRSGLNLALGSSTILSNSKICCHKSVKAGLWLGILRIHFPPFPSAIFLADLFCTANLPPFNLQWRYSSLAFSFTRSLLLEWPLWVVQASSSFVFGVPCSHKSDILRTLRFDSSL